MIEGIALAAKPSTVGRSDYPDVTCRHLENFRQRTMNIVRRLGRAPERQLLVSVVVSNRRVLLHRQMCIAFVEESVFANQIRFCETFFHLAELERDFLMDVAAITIFVNAWLIN